MQFWQTASDFDKQQDILTNRKLFWQTANYLFWQTVSNVILTNSKLFWQTATNFDKQQTNCKLIYNYWLSKNFEPYTWPMT